MKKKFKFAIYAVSKFCFAVCLVYAIMIFAMRTTACSFMQPSESTKDSTIVILDFPDSCRLSSKDSLLIDSVVNIANKTSSEIFSYEHKIDSLSTVVDKVNGQYASVIDMLIDKFNTWVGFWLAVISLILLIVSVWQYLKIEKYEERINKLEKDSDVVVKDIKKQSESLEVQMSNLQKQAKVYLDTQIAIHKYSTLENRMTSLLLCMSSVPDPQVFSDSEERKEQVNYYLGLVSGLLIKYFKLIEQESECHKLPEGTIACIPMVLLNLRLSLIRIQGMFRDPGIYIAFVKLIKQIEKSEASIRRTQLFGQNDVKELGIMVKSFNDFKTEIANCKEVV